MAVCLVTGGAGFIGSHLVEELVKRGDAVRVIDNLSAGQSENLDSVADQIRFTIGDVRDSGLVREFARGVDHVFHLAARTDHARCREAAEVTPPGYDELTPVLTAARLGGVKRVVFASCSHVYGN